MTIQEWLRMAQGRLQSAGIGSPKLEAQLLAAHVLLVDRPWLLAHGDEEFPALAGESVLLRRERGEPLAYILGYREFYGRRFAVNHRVLIPRQETETVVEAALAWRNAGSQAPIHVLDLGTGSGILAITYKLERPTTEVTAVDISPEALEVARENARALGAEVRFVLSDGFRELVGESFDLILINPPYVGVTEDLSAEVKGFEPHVALYAGLSGMEFFEILAGEAMDYLNDGGNMLMEVGYRQSGKVRGFFEERGWEVVSTHKDLSGIERVVVVAFPHACNRSS